MTRLSIAVWPPPHIIDVLAALDRPAVKGVRWSTREQWLIKVRPLGTVDQQLIPELASVLREELDGAPAVDCTLGASTVRLGGQWLGVRVEGLEDLGAVVFDATEAIVPVTHPQPFHAEVVLARGRVPKDLAGRPVSGAWTARSVSLVADRSSPKSPHFEDVATFPLGAS
jgi:2'-5' RNA ligase